MAHPPLSQDAAVSSPWQPAQPGAAAWSRSHRLPCRLYQGTGRWMKEGKREQREGERGERERQLGIGHINPRTASQHLLGQQSNETHTRNTTWSRQKEGRQGHVLFTNKTMTKKVRASPVESLASPTSILLPSSSHLALCPPCLLHKMPVLFHHDENDTSSLEKLLNTLKNIHIYQLLPQTIDINTCV